MEIRKTGFWTVAAESLRTLVSRPVYWFGIFVLPLFGMLFLTSEMENGLVVDIPAAVVDNDGTSLSRQLSQTLGSMQAVDLREQCGSYTEARHAMQEGRIYGFFLIPENFEKDLMAGKAPTVSFFTNMTYFVPGSLLYRTFQQTAVVAKAGTVVSLGAAMGQEVGSSTLAPVNITVRGIGNPTLNYAIYLCNSFVPGFFQLMIFLMTAFALGQTVKRGISRRLLAQCGGNPLEFAAAWLLPQTVVWILLILVMESWLYGFMGYPMRGSWFWMTLNEIMFVLACQAWGLAMYALLPSLRMSLSMCALVGILSFSLAGFSFPVEQMYGAVGIFGWTVPVRYNFMIYVDQALNGLPVWYSRWWYLAYLGFMALPLPLMWRLRKSLQAQVYAP